MITFLFKFKAWLEKSEYIVIKVNGILMRTVQKHFYGHSIIDPTKRNKNK